MSGRNIELNLWTGDIDELTVFLKQIYAEPNKAINVYVHAAANVLIWFDIEQLNCVRSIIASMRLDYVRTIRLNPKLGLVK